MSGWLISFLKALERWLRLRPAGAWRWLVRGGWWGAAVYSGVFAILFSLQVNNFLREKNPAGYRDVARRLNRVPALVDRLAKAVRKRSRSEALPPRATPMA